MSICMRQACPRYRPFILSVCVWLFFLFCFISYYYILIAQNNGFNCAIFTFEFKVLWLYSPFCSSLFCLLISLNLFFFFSNSPPSTFLLSLSAALKFHTWVKHEIRIFLSLAYFTKQNEVKFCLFWHVIWLCFLYG